MVSLVELMRGYIRKIENTTDDSGTRQQFTFNDSIESAWYWHTKEDAEIEIPRLVVMHENGKECSDFRVEKKREGEFVISCEVPS
jgi:hypothetical protein